MAVPLSHVTGLVAQLWALVHAAGTLDLVPGFADPAGCRPALRFLAPSGAQLPAGRFEVREGFKELGRHRVDGVLAAFIDHPHARGRGQLGHTRLLMGIDGRLVRLAVGKGREPRGRHAARRLQLLHLGDVDSAPDGRRLARGEADRIRVLVNAPPDAIDPAKAQGFVHRLRPAHAGAARTHLVKAHQQLRRAVCMALQPLAERLRGG